MSPALRTAYSWISSLLFLAMAGYVIYKYLLSIINRPKVERQAIIYEEWFASGCSMRNILTRLGGGHGCIRLVITGELLWVTSWFPFSLIAPFYDMEHVIPLNRITDIETRERWISTEVTLTYIDVKETSHRLKLVPKNLSVFLEALNKTDLLENVRRNPTSA